MTILRIEIKKIIHNKYGLPQNSVNIHFIACVNHTKIRALITNNMDFFDPKKRWHLKKKEAK